MEALLTQLRDLLTFKSGENFFSSCWNYKRIKFVRNTLLVIIHYELTFNASKIEMTNTYFSSSAFLGIVSGFFTCIQGTCTHQKFFWNKSKPLEEYIYV